MKNSQDHELINGSRNIDMIIRLVLIVGLLSWCIMLILPFVIPVLWAVIFAIGLYPLYIKLVTLFKGRKTLAGIISTGILMIVIIVPSAWLISAVVEGTSLFVEALRFNTIKIPPPDPSVADWPVIGDPVYNAWLLLTTNLEAVILKYSMQILKFSDKFIGALANFTSSVLMLLLSIIISGIFLVNSEKSEDSVKKFASRISGAQGGEFVHIVVLTIRNVVKGILGVAFMQFILLGGTFILAKIPFAGLWAVLVLLLAIVQLPAAIVGIPLIIYLFSSHDLGPAILWSVVIVIFSLSDNFLKPWLMGMGAPVPMLVIFLGAIGGMLMSGFIGLFTGAIVLSLGYKLAMAWLKENNNDKPAENPA
jgi:predicted PurR-regulated permease PerM